MTLREMIASIAANAAKAKAPVPPPLPPPMPPTRQSDLENKAREIAVETNRLDFYRRHWGIARPTRFWAAGFSIDALLARVKRKTNPEEPAK